MKRTYNRIGFALLVFGLVTFAGQIFIGIIIGLLSEVFPIYMDENVIMWISSFVPLYLIGVPVCLLMMKGMEVEPSQAKPLGAGNFFLFLLMCFPLMYGGNIIGSLLSAILSGGMAENALLDYMSGSVFLRILIMVIAAPLIEEYVFRKQIIDRTIHHGEKAAVFFSALTFGLFHMNLFQFFYAFGIGLIFAYVYVKTRRLRYPVLMHMVINFMGGVVAPYILTVVDLEAIAGLDPYTMSDSALMELLPELLLLCGYVILLMVLSLIGLILLIVKGVMSDFVKSGQRMHWKAVYGNPGVICYIIFCVICCIIALFAT